MPELPEVESTVRSLQRDVIGRRILHVEATWPRMIEPYSPSELSLRLVSKRIAAVWRRAKYIVVEVQGQNEREILLLHLRMSGRLLINRTPSNHDRITVTLSGGKTMRFVDPRKFGRFTLLDRGEFNERMEKLGPEPLEDTFRWQDLYQILTFRARTLKPLLLDQSIIAGLGNIYVDESLWSSALHPLRNSKTLTPEEVKRLHQNIRRILKRAISLNGTDFGDGVVHNGKFVPQVYGRAGEECRRCGSELERLVVATRGTVVCNNCQRV
ncbi:MAG: DNA-formamidopyrimidine glycosylase [Bdellovibrionales bacterium]|nr:DNA-formamidopyrimidine glycosylase [Bdellovibrionales bacterium]